MESKNTDLKKSVRQKISKLEKAEQDRTTILAQTVFLGTLGVVFILPVVIGAYLGLWLDEKIKFFSISWTISLIIVGVIVGAFNVYLLIKEV